MGKGRKGFHKEYSPPEEKFVVVVNAWGRSDNRQAYANNVAAWFEIILRRCHSKEKPQIYRIWYQNTHETLIVEMPEVVTDLQPFLGVHPYATFLTNAAGSDQCATLYEYNFKRFDHPERRNWKEVSPSYSRIPPNFPVRDPYPLPRDIELHLFIPTPQPPLNVPYAIPVPEPAIPPNLPPPAPTSTRAEGSKSNTPSTNVRQQSPVRNAGPSQANPQSSPPRSPSRSAHPSPPPSPPRIPAPRTPQPAPHSVQASPPAFTPYVPPSHHPAHSILTEARARGQSQRGPDHQEPNPLPMREESQATIPKKKMDLDPYEEEEVARKLLSMSRPQSEYPREGERQVQVGAVPQATPTHIIKPEPSDPGLPPPHSGCRSNVPSYTPSHAFPSPDLNAPQPSVSVKLEDISSSTVPVFDGGNTNRDTDMGEGGEDDADYEPSAALLDALADLDEFAGLLGAGVAEPGPAEATPATPSLSEQTGISSLEQAQIRVKPEPMDEDHLLDQALGPFSPSPQSHCTGVKPEPMDDGYHLSPAEARGPEASPTARPIPSCVRVKPEPMDEDYSLAPTPARGTPPRDHGRYRAAHDSYACDDSRRQPSHYNRDDPRRSPHHSDRDNRYHHAGSSSISRSPDTSRPHTYGSPQARWQGQERKEDRGSYTSSSNNRKRNSSRDGRGHKRERREEFGRDGEDRRRNEEDGRHWNKRPRVKMEPRD